MTTPPSIQAPPFGIGELARLSGRSTHTIRWYEAVGLLPGVRRDAANRRRYETRHVEWLALLARLRSTGMTTARIAEYAALVGRGSRATLPAQRALLDAHRSHVRERLAEWTAALALLDRKIARYDRCIADGDRR